MKKRSTKSKISKRAKRKFKYSDAVPINLSRFAQEEYFYDIWLDFQDLLIREREQKREQGIKPRSHDLHYLNCLKSVIANLVQSVLEDKSLAIGLRKDFYDPDRKRNPLGISKVYMDTVLGYLIVHNEKSTKRFLKDPRRSKFKDYGVGFIALEKNGFLNPKTGLSRVTLFAPTDKFKTFMNQWQATPSRSKNKRTKELRLIRISSPNENSKLVRRKVIFESERHRYEKVDQKHPLVSDTRKLLIKYNALMESIKIKLDVVTLDPPALYRLFIINRRKPDQLEWHGRFYAEGGHYQNFRQDFCKHLTIDESPVTELDFSSTHPTLAYDLKNLPRPTGDSYDFEILKPIDAMKQKMTARKAGKLLVNIAINALDESEAIDAFQGELALAKIKYGELGVGAFPRLIEALKAKHTPIREHFLSGNGNWFMFIDSEICRNVIIDFISDGKPILPKHDSFIVRRDDAKLLETSMRRHWVNVIRQISGNLNFNELPEIKMKY
ncbi:MAG: hypothetical protein A4S09_06280 [Proteobacteria bacterium SG_bin7]|nr:MAG: hypothetical protein A4S09_06280 [Proteobacteria bacterium SG_bin7]